MNRELLQQCLDALEWYVSEDDVIEGMECNDPWIKGKRNAEAAIEALKQELAKPEPEPVAWIFQKFCSDSFGDGWEERIERRIPDYYKVQNSIPLYLGAKQ